MRTSQYLLATTREAPADAETASHRLMLRGGLIRRLAAGLYTWLPLGMKVLRKAEQVVREEMKHAGALEVHMPMVQPAELWQESGRWEEYGPELLRLQDRHGRDFCLGPTHEEVITDLVKREVSSYRQLPLNLYQLQTKFRDEIRPRFGVMRAREFLMKDAYSFHRDAKCLAETYEKMRAAYQRIFSRFGLDFRMVAADSGSIGGRISHEFHVLAESGEDAIAFSEGGDYAANLELTALQPPGRERPPPAATPGRVATDDKCSIQEVAKLLQVPPANTIKILIAEGKDGGLAALALRGDHELNPLKAAVQEEVATPFRLADEKRIRKELGLSPGSLGPAGLAIPVIADYSAAHLADFVCGANEEGVHLTGINWGRDCPEPAMADLRNAEEGDPAPDGKGLLRIQRGIEVGHIFQLGCKYSEAMGAMMQAEDGQLQPLWMGCYGIGVGRAVAAAIEQNHDAAGICWPEPLAPFRAAVVPLNQHRSQAVREMAEKLYQQLLEQGEEVLLDDREERPGVKFADMELIGIPRIAVVGEKVLGRGMVECRQRGGDTLELTAEKALAFLAGK